jgi:AraC-like DNA-binding protein
MDATEDLGKLFSHFAALFNLRVSLLSPAREEIVRGPGKGCSEYCRIVGEELRLGDLCASTHKANLEKAAASGEPAEFTCHSGLYNLIIPLLVGERLLGFIATNGSRQVTDIPAAVQHKWDLQKGDGRLREAFLRTPYFRASEMQHIAGILAIIAGQISSREMLVPERDAPVETLVALMRGDSRKVLSLEEAAGLVNKSKSRLSHLFTEQLGKTFKDVQIEIKIEQAEGLLEKRATSSIQDIAFSLGFDDALYFTKFFKRHRGLSPIKFRESLKERKEPPT